MRPELPDFLDFCRLERRLAPLTCTAYQREVSACLRFLSERGNDDLGLMRLPDPARLLGRGGEAASGAR
jgi:site-specific recombinase XerC